MLKYVLKRLGYILVTLWVIVTCTFFMMKNLPGTPFDAERFSIMTPQQQERVLEMYGLNDSLPMQYVKYIKNMLKGDLGTSFTYVNQDVSKVITGRLGPSALIGIQAVLIGLAIGLILGILAAWKHNSGIDYFTMKKVQVTITHKVTRMYPNRFNTYFSMTSPFLSVKTDRIPAEAATSVYGPLLIP